LDASDRLGLSCEDTDNIIRSADNSAMTLRVDGYSDALRKKLLRACGLEEKR
jgi:hypothetical protein